MKFFYHFNFPPSEFELWQLENKYLFQENIENKYHLSNRDISVNQSIFIKAKISIFAFASSYDELKKQVSTLKLKYYNFKVIYYKLDSNPIEYQKRLEVCQDLSWQIDGSVEMRNPKHTLAITIYQGMWLFGYYHHGKPTWNKFEHKPFSFSNSLDVRLSRTLLNIASEGKKDYKLVDPCCGVGTVLLDGLEMGLDIQGFDINRELVKKTRKNLEYFGFPLNKVFVSKIEDLVGDFDRAIIDIPYNLYTPITPIEQLSIIKSAYNICNRLILVTYEQMDQMIEEANFSIVDKCFRQKTEYVRFGRYIYVLDKK